MPTTLLPPQGWEVSRSAWATGWAIRRAYAAALPRIVDRGLDPPEDLGCDVVTFSSEQDVPEQVASLRALLAHGGRPASVVVVSDGTHTPRSRALLERVDRSVQVVDWRDFSAATVLPPAVRAYAAASAMGKKLAVELSFRITRPLVYLDSDVLLLPAASGGLADAIERTAPAYLLDPEDVYLDDALLARDERVEPLNAGFLILPRPLDWSDALARLARLDGEPSFHTEQTLVHLVVRAAGGRPLDPGTWVVATDDMPERRDRHRGPDTVLRHYTSPVRHKFWLAVGALGGARARAGAA